MQPSARSPRRLISLIAALAAATLGISLFFVIRAAREGVPRIAVQTRIEGGEGVVAFTNQGGRAGYACGWVNVACGGGENRATFLCSDEVLPGSTREKRVPLVGSGCTISFVEADDPVL